MRSRDVVGRMALPAVFATIALAALGAWASAGTGGIASARDAAESGSMDAEREVILYYFHGTRRCKTCRTIESFSNRFVRKYQYIHEPYGRVENKLVSVSCGCLNRSLT